MNRRTKNAESGKTPEATLAWMRQAAGRSDFAELPGARLWYEAAGEGTTAVLLHSGIGDSRIWDDVFRPLAQCAHIVRYDLRGFGRSTATPETYSHARDLADLLDHLSVENAALVGASFGGGIALDFAVTYPERVSGLVLAAPALSGWIWSAEIEQFGAAEDEALAAGDVQRATDLNVVMWVDGGRPRERVDPALRARVRTLQREEFERALRAEESGTQPGAREEIDPPASKRLETISVPTLVMIGDGDVADFRAIADSVAVRVPKAEKVVFEGVGHLIPLERPHEFLTHATRFLSL